MKKKWFRLDNAALIFPAIMKRRWNNVFRLSAELREDIDPLCLERAAEDLRARFPSFFVRLRAGLFWYYLEEVRSPVRVLGEYAYPLAHMSRRELGSCCIRILYYEKRISAEFFHSVTDGHGGLVFLKNLTARYLELKYGEKIPAEYDIAELDEPPKAEELRDCFQLCCGRFAASRREETVWRLRGRPERDRFRHIVTGVIPTGALLDAAHARGVSVTAFLAAVMTEAVSAIQQSERPVSRLKPVKITVPVDLRRLFGMDTLRNFSLTVNVGFDPKTGDYSLEELCSQISHQLALEAVPQKMAGRIAANVKPQRNVFIRVMPLFIKNVVMRGVYASVGEKKGCLNISNLGPVRLPAEMEKHVARLEFIIGVQYTYPNNCSVISFGGVTCVNMIRSSEEPELERLFFSRLVELGIPVSIESNKKRRS